jgi:hypothetical protein
MPRLPCHAAPRLPGYFPNIELALRLILAALAGDSFPAFTICVARLFALAAWARSGIGYFRDPGRPNLLVGIAFRAFVVS